MCINGNVFGPKRETIVWHFDVKITSYMSIKNALFTDLVGSQD